MSQTPRVTVILRCKNSEREIAAALAALFAQEFDDFELLVVDSGSTDRTLEIVAAYPHRLLRIAPEEYFPGPVLNRAVEACGTELVVFYNSDVVPLHRRVLGSLVAAFDDPEVAAAFGRQVPRPEAWASVRREYALSFPERGAPPPWITLSLPLAAMRRAAWERHPFYSAAWASEDTEWGQWALGQGLRIAYVPQAEAMHSHNYTLRQLFGRRYVEGEADAFIYGARFGWLGLLRRLVTAVARDVGQGVRERRWGELPRVPLHCAVYHWAHFSGHRHGLQRRDRGDHDAAHGQRVVLARR